MKIGFFTDRYYPQVDGVAVSVELFAKELIKLGHEVVIFAPQSADKKQTDPAYVVRFRSFPSIWYEDHRETMPFTPAIIKQVRSHNLDIVHIHTPAQIGLLGMRIAKEDNIPVVSTHHTDIDQYVRVYKKMMIGVLLGILVAPALLKSTDKYKELLPYLKPNRSIKTWNRKLILESIGIFYQNCDAVIAPSLKMVKSLKDYGNFDNVHVLPTGIDLQELDIKTTFEPRRYYQIASDSPLLLFVGRLGKEKNIQLIIRSMPKILESNPSAKLLIVGDGPYGEELKELAETTGAKQNIVFAGMLDRAKTFACFKTSDIFCFASLTDTQGLVLNEAAIVSKPIVFLDSEISPLTKDKATGILSKNSVSSFTAACNKLIDNKDLAATYGKKAKSIAMTITIDKQAKKLLKIYSDIV